MGENNISFIYFRIILSLEKTILILKYHNISIIYIVFLTVFHSRPESSRNHFGMYTIIVCFALFFAYSLQGYSGQNTFV